MFCAPFAGLLMQVTQCLAQPRTTAAWDSSARAKPTRGCQNSFAFPRALLSQLVRLLRSDANQEMSATLMMQLWKSSSSFYPMAGAPLLR
jgi:hypothetical protein